jgi:hypothetical protein
MWHQGWAPYPPSEQADPFEQKSIRQGGEPHRGRTVSQPGTPSFSSYRNCLEELATKRRDVMPSYEVTLKYEKTGDVEIFKNLKKADRTLLNQKEYLCKKIEEDDQDVIKKITPDRLKELTEVIRKRKEDGPISYHGKVEYKNKTYLAPFPQDTIKKAEQCATYQALKELKLIPADSVFNMEYLQRQEHQKDAPSSKVPEKCM